MNLLFILPATLAAGIGSVWIAALLMRVGVRNGTGGLNAQHLLSLAAGALLATAFMHLLPEAFEGGIEPSRLFAALLFGVVFFFLLDKAELWHHGHEHGHGHDHHHDHDDGHGHGHGHSHGKSTGGWAVLTGDSVHCFGDGVPSSPTCAWAWSPPSPCSRTRCRTTSATSWCCARVRPTSAPRS